jgi:hypothetical protein
MLIIQVRYLVLSTMFFIIPDWIRIRIGIQPRMLDPDSYHRNTVRIRNTV